MRLISQQVNNQMSSFALTPIVNKVSPKNLQRSKISTVDFFLFYDRDLRSYLVLISIHIIGFSIKHKWHWSNMRHSQPMRSKIWTSLQMVEVGFLNNWRSKVWPSLPFGQNQTLLTKNARSKQGDPGVHLWSLPDL